MFVSVSIVEDNQGTRESLVEIVRSNPKFRCIGAYGSAEEALENLPHSLPDVVLMDIELPGRSGIECTMELKALYPKLLILVLTTYDDGELIFNAFRAGATGYLLKRSLQAELLAAIDDIYRGGAPMTPSIARHVVLHFRQAGQPHRELESLTPREREVLDELAKGYLYKEVAERLGINVGTVNKHIDAIYKKLHVQTRTEALLKLRGAPDR